MTTTDAAIARIWPAPASESLDDSQLMDTFVVGDRGRQSVRVNFVASADGAVTEDGLSGGLSGRADKRVFNILRRLCDVVLVGAGTVRDEGYGPMRLGQKSMEWRAAHGLAAQPVFAIVSGSLGLDPSSRVFTEAPVRAIVVTVGSSPRAKRDALSRVADVIVCGDGSLDVDAMLAEFARRGLAQVLCEGGPTLFGTLLAAGRVDELCLTVSPLLESGDAGRIATGPLPAAVRLSLNQALVSDGALMLRYLRG